MTEWFYSKNGKQFGPISTQELKALADQSQIESSDLVWKNGMSEWRAAREFKGLFTRPTNNRVIPPPLPPSLDIRSQEDFENGIAIIPRPKPPILPVLLGVGCVLFGFFNGLGFFVYSLGAFLNPPENAPPIASTIPWVLAFLDIFVLMQLPGGIGILLHRSWGVKTASASILGTVVISGFGTLLTLVLGGRTAYSEIFGGIFLWGLASGFFWGIFLSVFTRFRSVKDVIK